MFRQTVIWYTMNNILTYGINSVYISRMGKIKLEWNFDLNSTNDRNGVMIIFAIMHLLCTTYMEDLNQKTHLPI